MNQILCSTGALLGYVNKKNYRLLETLAKELCCDGYELMIYSSWHDETEEIAGALREMKINTPVVHSEKGIGDRISRNEPGDVAEAIRVFELNCRLADSIGAEKMVLHLWGGPPSDQHIENNLAVMKELLEITEQYNFDLLVENVVCNKENPMKHWCELVQRYPQIQFVFDTKMAAFHEQLELLYDKDYEWLWKENHIRHYHVNDYAGGYMDWANLRTLPIGEGHIDFERFFSFIHHCGYEGTYTVEATAFDKTGTVDTGMLNRCFTYIREHLIHG